MDLGLTPEQQQSLLNIISTQALIILLKVFIVAVVISAMKGFGESLLAYVLLSFKNSFGKGAKIQLVSGSSLIDGQIHHIGLFNIVIETEKPRGFMYIQTKTWTDHMSIIKRPLA